MNNTLHGLVEFPFAQPHLLAQLRLPDGYRLDQFGAPLSQPRLVGIAKQLNERPHHWIGQYIGSRWSRDCVQSGRIKVESKCIVSLLRCDWQINAKHQCLTCRKTFLADRRCAAARPPECPSATRPPPSGTLKAPGDPPCRLPRDTADPPTAASDDEAPVVDSSDRHVHRGTARGYVPDCRSCCAHILLGQAKRLQYAICTMIKGINNCNNGLCEIWIKYIEQSEGNQIKS